MTTTVFPEVMQDMADSAYRQQVYIVAETQMHVAPWLFEDEGWEKSRLKAAIELVCTGKVAQTAGGWHVQGSSREGYDIPGDTLACPCKAAKHGSKSKICKHRVAIELARRVQQAYPEAAPLHRSPTPDDDALGNGYPVDDETLPLPLPPVTVDERLAARITPQEDRMADDQYIPEPEIDEAPVAVVEPRNGMSHDTPHASPLATALVQWSAQRQVVKEFLSRELREGIDFYTLQIRGKASKPSLSKAGAEKFLGLMQLQASFAPDLGTWEMLGKPTDQIMYVCQLRTRSGEIVGEGRGARSLKQDGGDINKALKMSEKSALIDAVLRTGALSDAFTQDLDDEEPAKVVTPTKPTSQDLRQRIWAQVQKMDGTVRTREQVEAFIKERTSLELHPDTYSEILHRLEKVD